MTVTPSTPEAIPRPWEPWLLFGVILLFGSLIQGHVNPGEYPLQSLQVKGTGISSLVKLMVFFVYILAGMSIFTDMLARYMLFELPPSSQVHTKSPSSNYFRASILPRGTILIGNLSIFLAILMS